MTIVIACGFGSNSNALWQNLLHYNFKPFFSVYELTNRKSTVNLQLITVICNNCYFVDKIRYMTLKASLSTLNCCEQFALALMAKLSKNMIQ